ncbi:hypothetical protein DV26_01875 [Amycolatopsis mediterranei]|uniref:Uncharacterized protein n=1 Tax=Amycolatopsis mediterranei (strain S699) TaxID=713604 RepID=A0A9R0P0Z3_AMYMS|nr:hypothetical protein RAM_28765 [Amycolatopsis mediterranei S699]KDO12427.1 hypothetical protein DV26_01875 [Amycolatopsis mediterranei]KDU88496.1 hypothetical protein DV36_29665 [Amycolatopsis mediterranei]
MATEIDSSHIIDEASDEAFLADCDVDRERVAGPSNRLNERRPSASGRHRSPMSNSPDTVAVALAKSPLTCRSSSASSRTASLGPVSVTTSKSPSALPRY